MSKRHDRRSKVLEEFEYMSLGDPRRARRGKSIAGRLAFRPEASLPVAMGDEAMLEGTYRHLSSPHVTLDSLLRPHVAMTAKRVARVGVAYAIHDTSGFTFGGEVRREGLGHVDSKSDQGFRAHVSFAVAADETREPLGLLAVGTRVRPRRN